MRKIRLFIASSLDGYIARTSGQVDWLFTDQDYGYAEFFAQVDTVLMGRRTYQQILDFGEYPYKGTIGFVFSRTLQGTKDDNVEFVWSDLKDFIRTLRQLNGRDIWLVGGSQTISFFIEHGFVDELILSIHPIILGSGIPLITNNPNLETALELKDVRTYDSGLLQVSYALRTNPVDSA